MDNLMRARQDNQRCGVSGWHVALHMHIIENLIPRVRVLDWSLSVRTSAGYYLRHSEAL